MAHFHIHSTPVLLLTGYLGSGKTTLLNRILHNKKGIRFAVIVNDIGEVNIDSFLVARQGVVSQSDDSLVSLDNGCICCTLKMDLVEQITDLLKLKKFDYIVIEASGICDPQPIAYSICSIPELGEEYFQYGIPRLDCLVTVVDALRMRDEFSNGKKILTDRRDDDIENLIVQQIEFCNIVLLNKISEVDRKDVDYLKQIVTVLNPNAKIIETDYADVDFKEIFDTHMFDYRRVNYGAGWLAEFDKETTLEEDLLAKYPHMAEEIKALWSDREEEHDHHCHQHDDHECCCHHHDDDDDECECHHHDDHSEHHHHDEDGCCCCGHHHHHNENGEAEEYGISTFVYYRRAPFDYSKFDRFLNNEWPRSIIRCKGVCYFSRELNKMYLFEQAGTQVQLSDYGEWLSELPEEEIQLRLFMDPSLNADWDDEYGDKKQKLVFIGQKMEKEAIIRALDNCLVTNF